MTAPLESPPVPRCERCGNEKSWRECYNCEDGFSDHDCGEDCCVCLGPEPNVRCDICSGKGGWLQCSLCYPFDDDYLFDELDEQERVKAAARGEPQ